MPRKQRAEGAEPGQWGEPGAIFDVTGRAGPGQEQTGAESGRQGGRTAACLRLTPGSCCSRPLGTWGPGRGSGPGRWRHGPVSCPNNRLRGLHPAPWRRRDFPPGASAGRAAESAGPGLRALGQPAAGSRGLAASLFKKTCPCSPICGVPCSVPAIWGTLPR